MAVFPELIPSQRTYSPGAYPHTAHRVYRGSETRVRHSNTVLGPRLRLFFPALITADLVLVRDHYNGRRGRFLPFAIPEEVLSGLDDPASFTPAGYQWRYAAKPVVRDIPVDGDTPTNFHDLTIELELVPPENTIAPGARLRRRVRIRAGSAERGAFIPVMTRIVGGEAGAAPTVITVTVQIAGGAATDDSITGTLLTGSPVGGGLITLSSITYSQSSIWEDNIAATNAAMTNWDSDETLETGTDALGDEWIRMDLGASFLVRRVIIGSASENLAGGWDETYLNTYNLQYSTDATTWTTVGTISGFGPDEIRGFDVNWNARYIRVQATEQYIAVTEFYATTDP